MLSILKTMLALYRIAQLFGIVGHQADTKSYIQYSMNTYPIVTTSTLEIGAAQLRSVAEIAPKSPFLCVNRSPSVPYGFSACAKAIRDSMNTYPISDSPLKRSARRSFALLLRCSEIAPKSPFLCLNKSCIRSGFRACVEAIRYSVNFSLGKCTF